MLNARSRDGVLTPEQIGNICGHFRENPNQLWIDRDLPALARLRSPSAREKATKLMRFIRQEFPSGGEQFEVFYSDAEKALTMVDMWRSMPQYEADTEFVALCHRILPFVGAAWSHNAGDFLFTFNEYIRKGENWIVGTDNGNTDAVFRITPAGWNFLDNLDVQPAEATTAFVAMWFKDETAAAWRDAISPAIEDAGYTPLRIDLHEHDNHIDDEIIAAIRGARFVIADLTGGRGGVYWEAGFGFGLGKKVIWSVRNDELAKVHFDVRQYPFLVWDETDLPDFRKRLAHRIVARIGAGPRTLRPTEATSRQEQQATEVAAADGSA